MPERFSATPGASLRFELLRSANFYGPGEGTEPVGVGARALCRLGGEAAAMGPIGTGAKSAGFSATLGRPGVAAVLVEFESRTRERSPEEAEAYLRRNHVGEAARAALSEGFSRPLRRERITERARTFVRVGEPEAGDRSWGQPLSQSLDLLPVTSPSALRVGAVFSVKVLQAGLPVEGRAVGFVLAGESRENVVFSGVDGEAATRLDVPGLWLVYCSDIQRSGESDVDWVTQISTLVIEVK